MRFAPIKKCDRQCPFYNEDGWNERVTCRHQKFITKQNPYGQLISNYSKDFPTFCPLKPLGQIVGWYKKKSSGYLLK